MTGQATGHKRERSGVVLGIRLPREQHARLKELAARHERTVSGQTRWLIERWVQEQEAA